MGLRKGQTNNPAGRPKGAVNRLAEGFRKGILDFLEDDFPAFEETMRNLRQSGKYIEYIRAYIDLMKYGISPAQAKEEEATDSAEEEELVNTIIKNSKK